MQCPDGYHCDPMHWRCQPNGDLVVGESCEWNDECQTGVCNRNTWECDEQCLADGDCPEDAYCIGFGGGWSGNGCSENFNCTVSCPPPERCGGHTCIPQACETTADCDTGDCKMHRQRPDANLPRCVEPEDPDVDRYCKPEERYDVHGHHCYLPGSCWDDSHCDDPYTCEWNRCLRWLDLDEEDS